MDDFLRHFPNPLLHLIHNVMNAASDDIRNNGIQKIKLLLSAGAPVNGHNNDVSPLRIAIYGAMLNKANIELLNLLIESGAILNPLTLKNEEIKLFFNSPIATDNSVIVKLFLLQKGANFNIKIEDKTLPTSDQSTPSVRTTTIDAPLVLQNKLLSQEKTESFVPRTDVSVPASVVLPVLFHLGSSAGLCSKSLEPISLKFSSHSQRFFQAQAAEKSAERYLQKSNHTLKSALKKLFGKSYTKASSDEQERLKKAIVRVINGDVSAEDGKEFNRLSLIANTHLRTKQLLKLIDKIETPNFPSVRIRRP